MERLSTAQTYDSTIQRLVKRQQDLSETQGEMSSGKRIQRASDDPTNAARAERALASMQRIDATQRGVQTSQTMMTQAEGALGDANDLLQRARELVVSAGNPSYSKDQRLAIADELKGIRDQLFGIANRSDGANGFLFGAQGSQQPPFLDGPGGVSFRGDSGQAMIGTAADGQPLTLDGKSAWLSASTGNGTFATSVVASTGTAVIDAGTLTTPATFYAQPPSTYDITFDTTVTPNTYSVTRTPLPPAAATTTTLVNAATFTPGQAISFDGMSMTITGNPAGSDHFQVQPSTSTLSVFNVLDKAVSDLSSGATATQIAQSNAQNLNNIDSVMNRIQLSRSQAGNALTMLDNATSRLDSQQLQAETQRSNAEDIDMVKAIADFQSKQTGYQAALQSYSMVQHQSLFNYINS